MALSLPEDYSTAFISGLLDDAGCLENNFVPKKIKDSFVILVKQLNNILRLPFFSNYYSVIIIAREDYVPMLNRAAT